MLVRTHRPSPCAIVIRYLSRQLPQMQNIVTSVSFRNIDPRHKEPGPSREFIHQNILLPAGAHLPRMGEAIELIARAALVAARPGHLK